ncbi:hypothetical protein DSL72_008149 [Monilinia vaccinii-corymbosi]|uniref:Uncharacterized protein n=1 Tax=Monilinia vaccinii-corymbosi TaxID=61207 RepID=A0A8A3PJL5_9HELO|nr:hypothetical protein DSL72_008149 [Monilinia vaccinii-corymbosi]
MLSIILQFLRLNKTLKNSGPEGFTNANRLQNQASYDDLAKNHVLSHRIYSEVPTDFRAQSCLTLVEEEEEEETIGIGDGNNDVASACTGRVLIERRPKHGKNSSITQSRTTIQYQKHAPRPRPRPRSQNNINLNINPIHRIPSTYSISIYSSDEIYPTENMESFSRRAKTPVFFIGQLERRAIENDPSECLANEYQAVLPRSHIASYLDLSIPLTPARRILRKIQSQESLRDLYKSYVASPCIASDCETLVGSDGGSSRCGSIFKGDVKDDSFEFKGAAPPTYKRSGKTSPLSNQDISLQICSDLLTNKLATALRQGHTIGREIKVSGLEILLMIEAYESIRKELRLNPRDIHVISAAETALDQWIQALYTVYENCHGIRHSSQRRWNE